jgi:hypothetical protein
MKRSARISLIVIVLAVLAASGSIAPAPASAAEVRRLPVKEYRDKMKAGWIGQIAGVCWGGPTEGKSQKAIMPESAMPKWTPGMINDAFGQDDLYVEMTFLRSMEEYGLDVSIRQAGIDFANSGYPLWCANNAGRTNLRRGIAPPDSSHPKFNRCPNDIDYQIEADYSGLIAPGAPQAAIALGEKFGRLMNYGDGMYAGQFMGGMYAEAFFETDVRKLVEAGLRCIPSECQYATMVRDLLRWHAEDPTGWEKTWEKIEAKYAKDPEYLKASNGPGIDCKSNGAYVLLGLLYGDRDLDRTIVISCRAGKDSDCNPSSSGGVLFTTVGFSKLPERFTKELDEKRIFSHTAYSFPALLDVCEKLARQVIAREGGRVEKDSSGGDVFVIPVKAPVPSKLELSWAPRPIAGSRFTEEEMAKITAAGSPAALRKDVEKFAPGWTIADCGTEMEPGLHAEWNGRKGVLVTHPLDRDTPCRLSRKLEVPRGDRAALHIIAGHHPEGDWDLIVRIDGKECLRRAVGKDTAKGGWLETDVDLSAHAGKTVAIEILNQPTGWAYEAAYWGEIRVGK